MRFKYGIVTFGIALLVLLLVGCGKGQPNKEGHGPNSQSSVSVNGQKPNSTLYGSNPNSKTNKSTLKSIQMVNAITGWATTEGSILRTDDGGVSWTDVTPKGTAGQIFGPIFSRDGQTAWIATTQEDPPRVSVYRTENGGLNWDKSEINVTEPLRITSLSFPDSTHGWILASYGVAMGSESIEIFKTVDGGASWKSTASAINQEMPNGLPLTGSKNGLTFADQKNGWLTGFTHGDGIWLYTTGDEGLTWNPKNLAAPSGYNIRGGSVSTEPPRFFGPKVGLLPAEFRGQTPPALVFYMTQDGGVSWDATTPVKSTQEPFRGFKWSVVDAQHGFVSDGYKLYHTSDGTRSFSSIAPNINLKNLQQLAFISEQFGWAIVDGGLWKTSDGGRIWTEVSLINTNSTNAASVNSHAMETGNQKSNPLFDTTLTFPNGQIVTPDNQPVQWKDLSVSLQIQGLPSPRPDRYLSILGNHSTVLSQSNVFTSAGTATLVLNERTPPAAAQSTTPTYEYWVIVCGSQYAYAIKADVIGNRDNAKNQVMELLDKWKVPN